jgi:Zn-dependent protease
MRGRGRGSPSSVSNNSLISGGPVASNVLMIFDRQDFGYAAPAIAFLGYVNVVIALANLAPAPGFDGRIAWRVVPLLWKRRTATGSRRRRR